MPVQPQHASERFSIIVTAHNNAAVLERTLASAEIALRQGEQAGGAQPAPRGEIVVVDDGSTDETWAVLRACTAGKPAYRTLRRRQASSPSQARNQGVAMASGDVLFFLDGDDLYRPTHVAVALAALADPGVAFAKTGVRLADPVHPDWRPRIEGSLVLNLAVRRHAHLAIGGFLDWHLFCRDGDLFRQELDVFYKLEDQYYHVLLGSLFPGVRILQETVEYLRYPGNAFDRQYAKFCQPFGAYVEAPSAAARFQLELCDVIVRECLRRLCEQYGRPLPPGRP